MSYKPFSKYHVVVSSGDDPGGAESLCQAAKKQFPGLVTESDGIENQPAGLIVDLIGGKSQRTPNDRRVDDLQKGTFLLEIKQDTA